MVRTALHLLLMAAIFCCPLRCQGNDCAPNTECSHRASSIENACDRCCQAGSSNSHPSDCKEASKSDRPSKHGPPCEHHCQCICEGAVFVSGNEELKQRGLDALLNDLSSSVASLNEQLARRKTGMIDLRLAQSGREMRILHASYLC